MKKFLVLTVISCICLTGAFAQAIRVSGVVTDAADGRPLPGAGISVKGTSAGVTTDSEGRFTLASVAADATLVVSFVGYKRQEIKIEGRVSLDIVMTEDAQAIDEVVVVGYGTQKKSTLTGSVAAVESKQLVATKNTNVQNMLTGKLPGLRNIQKTSEPGVFSNQFDIRGMGTPLLVVDGVPRSELPRMDPNDIESVSILKDAAAAIYGVRAGNGVILITTKKGEQGRAKIEYAGYYGLQTPAELLRPVGAYDRAVLYNETTMRNTVAPVKEFDDEYFEKLAKGELPDTDWYDAVMRKFAPQQQHSISVSGGTEKVDYYINLGYADQGSFFKSNAPNYHRYNMRTNVNAQITENLKAGVKLNMTMDKALRQFRESWTIFKMLFRSRPNDPLYANDTAPYFYHPDIEYNPAAAIDPDIAGHSTTVTNMFQSNLYVEYAVPNIKGLTAQVMFSYDKTYLDFSYLQKEFYEYRYNEATGLYDPTLMNSKSMLRRRYTTTFGTLWNARLNYDNTFAGAHHVGALLLYEESYSQGYNFSGTRYFDIPVFYLFAGNAANQQVDGTGLSETATKALVGRASYDYAGKYLAEFSFRYDGSSRFPKGKQWGFFPSAALGYRISEESFIKDNVPFLQNLKIRGSWGRLGDDGALNFQFVEGFDYPQSSHNRASLPRGYVFGNTFVNAVGFRNAPNPNITWYTSTMKNIGVDADMWNGLFGFSVDLFRRDRDGLLANPDVVAPATFGAGISQANLEADLNKGFEVELRHRHKIGKFSYNASGYVQMTRRMWTKRLNNYLKRSNSYDYWRNNVEGRYDDVWFGKGANGQYQSYDEIANSIYAGAGTLPGDPIYEDWNGDGVIDGNDDHPIATTTSPGTSLENARNYPLMNFGLTLGGQWKCIDFNLLFQGAAMSWVGYSDYLKTPLLWDGNALEMFLDRWRPADPDRDPYDPSNTWISGFFPYGKTRAEDYSAFNIQNGAYLRLKSAEIGFTVPQNIVFKKIGLKNMRIYVNAYNLLTITGVRGVDPERPSETYGYLYPLNRTFNFGGSITF